MHVDIQIAFLEGFKLGFRQVHALRHHPGIIAFLLQRDDNRAILAGWRFVNVGHGAGHVLGGHTAADLACRIHLDGAAAVPLGFDRRHLIFAGQGDVHFQLFRPGRRTEQKSKSQTTDRYSHFFLQHVFIEHGETSLSAYGMIRPLRVSCAAPRPRRTGAHQSVLVLM